MFVYLNFLDDYFFCYKIIDELFSLFACLQYKNLDDYVIQNRMLKRVLIDNDYDYKTLTIEEYRLDSTNSINFIQSKYLEIEL